MIIKKRTTRSSPVASASTCDRQLPSFQSSAKPAVRKQLFEGVIPHKCVHSFTLSK